MKLSTTVAKVTMPCEVSLIEGPDQAILHLQPNTPEQREVSDALQKLAGEVGLDIFSCSLKITGASTGFLIVFDKSAAKKMKS